MPYNGQESVAATSAVKTVAALTIPSGTTLVELQARTQGVNYTMDGSSLPAVGVGMVLLTTQKPKLFTVEDVLNIKFIRNGGSDAVLEVHYLS